MSEKYRLPTNSLAFLIYLDVFIRKFCSVAPLGGKMASLNDNYILLYQWNKFKSNKI
jgi:hypothetical protein